MEDSCLLHLYMYYNIVDSIKKAAGGVYGSMSEMLVWPLTFKWGEAETVPSIIDQPSLITTLSVHLHKKPGNKPMSEQQSVTHHRLNTETAVTHQQVNTENRSHTTKREQAFGGGKKVSTSEVLMKLSYTWFWLVLCSSHSACKHLIFFCIVITTLQELSTRVGLQQSRHQ